MELTSLDIDWTNQRKRSAAPPLMELTAGSMTVLFSYGRPVACHDKATGQYYFLEYVGVTHHDGAITKHINTWLADVEAATPMAQDFFDSLLQPNYAELWEATG